MKENISAIIFHFLVNEVTIGEMPNQIVYEDLVNQDTCKLQVWKSGAGSFFSGICQRLWISAFYLSCLDHQSAVIVLAYCADMAQIWIISDDSVIKDAHNKIWTF